MAVNKDNCEVDIHGQDVWKMVDAIRTLRNTVVSIGRATNKKVNILGKEEDDGFSTEAVAKYTSLDNKEYEIKYKMHQIPSCSIICDNSESCNMNCESCDYAIEHDLPMRRIGCIWHTRFEVKDMETNVKQWINFKQQQFYYMPARIENECLTIFDGLYHVVMATKDRDMLSHVLYEMVERRSELRKGKLSICELGYKEALSFLITLHHVFFKNLTYYGKYHEGATPRISVYEMNLKKAGEYDYSIKCVRDEIEFKSCEFCDDIIHCDHPGDGEHIGTRHWIHLKVRNNMEGKPHTPHRFSYTYETYTAHAAEELQTKNLCKETQGMFNIEDATNDITNIVGAIKDMVDKYGIKGKK